MQHDILRGGGRRAVLPCPVWSSFLYFLGSLFWGCFPSAPTPGADCDGRGEQELCISLSCKTDPEKCSEALRELSPSPPAKSCLGKGVLCHITPYKYQRSAVNIANLITGERKLSLIYYLRGCKEAQRPHLTFLLCFSCLHFYISFIHIKKRKWFESPDGSFVRTVVHFSPQFDQLGVCVWGVGCCLFLGLFFFSSCLQCIDLLLNSASLPCQKRAFGSVPSLLQCFLFSILVYYCSCKLFKIDCILPRHFIYLFFILFQASCPFKMAMGSV